MGKGSPFKILIAMALGFALAAVGMDTVTGQLRLTFGQAELMRGFDFLIAVIGLFGACGGWGRLEVVMKSPRANAKRKNAVDRRWVYGLSPLEASAAKFRATPLMQ